MAMFGARIVTGGTDDSKKGHYLPFIQATVTDRAKFMLEHLYEFGIHLQNNHSTRCRATIIFDGNDKQPAGTWILNPHTECILYRKATDDKAFQCMKLGSSESNGSGVDTNNMQNGFIDVIFSPEVLPKMIKEKESSSEEEDEKDDDDEEEEAEIKINWRRGAAHSSSRKQNKKSKKYESYEDGSSARKEKKSAGSARNERNMKKETSGKGSSGNHQKQQSEHKAHVAYGQRTGQVFYEVSDIGEVDRERIRTAHMQVVCVDKMTLPTTTSIAANPLYVRAIAIRM